MNASEIHKKVGFPIHETIGLPYQYHEAIGSKENIIYRAFTVSDIEKIIADARAKKKGVCKWRKHRTFAGYKTTACARDYYHSQAFRFCPGCGKKIKVV